jgi:hypothetical protein
MLLTYTNATGETAVLRQTKPFFLTKADGLSSIQQSVNTFGAPEQDGAFFISSTLDMRNITLEGNLVAAGNSEITALRRQLLRIFTPKQRGTLTCGDRQISCHVEEAGFAQGTSHRVPAFFISLLCPSPYFEALNAARAELAAWIGSFSFPLEIPASGMEFGHRQPSQIITIDNDGVASCGCEIIFRALGSVKNPSLLNIDTGEFVRLLTTMTAGQEIRVYTHFAGKRVESWQGTGKSNAFSLIDTGSTFLQLNPGKNVMKYDAAANLDLLEVTVIYRPLFWSV